MRLKLKWQNASSFIGGWSMAQSIKLGDDIMTVVRRECELQSRSIAGQIAHWVRIGRAIEKSGNLIMPASRLRLQVPSRQRTSPTRKKGRLARQLC
jgi:hypothetical protein